MDYSKLPFSVPTTKLILLCRHVRPALMGIRLDCLECFAKVFDSKSIAPSWLPRFEYLRDLKVRRRIGEPTTIDGLSLIHI